MAQSAFASMFTLSLIMFLSLEAYKEQSNWYALLIFAIRFSSNITFNLGYLQSASAFPTLATGLAFTITNFFCRFATLFAPFLAEAM